MFNFIKFSEGFEEGSKFYDIEKLKKDKEFMSHKKSFEKNSYVIENCTNEELPVIDDIKMGQFFYKGKRNIMFNITAADNAVDICLDVDATGNIYYTVTSGIKECITVEDYFNVNKAIENVYHMIKKFAEYCVEEPFKVAEDIAEIINENYKCTLDEEGTLIVEHNNAEVTVKDFPKIIMESDPDFDYFNVEIGNIEGKKLNISELETADDIIKTIRNEISKVWGD